METNENKMKTIKWVLVRWGEWNASKLYKKCS